MKKFRFAMIIAITLALVGWLHASGVGYQILDFFSDPTSVVPSDVDIKR